MIDHIQERLIALSEPGYRDFSASLMPTVDKSCVLGVRVPHLRRMAKELKHSEVGARFLATLPHRYHEENMLHALLLGEMTDPDRCFTEIDRFLPFVDNWAVCDSLRPRCPIDKAWLWEKILDCLASPHPYTVRFGIEMLMLHFLGDAFEEKHLARVAAVESQEYYVNMMIAWYFATALAVQYESTLPYLQEHRLSPWIHRKTIQKAVESLQISNERKEYLKALRMGRKETI